MYTHRYLRIIMLALFITAGAGIFATQASPASADSDVCVAASNQITYWCAMVRGQGGRVNYVEAAGQVLKKPSKDLSNIDDFRICNYRTEVRISGNGNTHFATFQNSAPPGGCAYGRAWNRVQIGWDYPKGFYVCTKFFINYTQQQGREVCIKLT
jgi:hypothetical protein